MNSPDAIAAVHKLHIDFETRSLLELNKVGPSKYATHPSTNVLCCAYAVDGEPVKIWMPGDPPPRPVHAAALDPDYWIIVAHNASFEMAIMRHVVSDWPGIPVERFRCTMAKALALALPRKLEKLADALDLLHRKDAAGHRLMLAMTKPRRPRKGEDPALTYWFDDEERLQRLYAYCMKDVEVEREADGVLCDLIPAEQEVWLLDQAINARGFHFDRALAESARRLIKQLKPELNRELAETTGGAVTTVDQIPRLKAWLGARGLSVHALDADAVTALLAQPELPARARRALELRQEAAGSSIKKIDAMLLHGEDDDRVRYSLIYHVASTGRWGGNGVQPQNLKRLPKGFDVEAAVAAIGSGDVARVRELAPRPLDFLGYVCRPLIDAAPGCELIGADLSAIESRALAWVAGEEWKLDSYLRFDATHDPRDEPYCITACKIFRVPDGTFNSESPERQVGKICDLAFGYQGGLGAWRAFDPDRFTDEEVERFKWEWRGTHPRIKQFWYDIDGAALLAVRERGKIIKCGRILLKCAGMFLQIKLPSGRKLSYPYPRIETRDWLDRQREVVLFKDASAGQWRDIRHGDGAYGGVWTENIVSGLCRDLLSEAMPRLEAAGYRIVLHVHDELVCEVPIGFGDVAEFTKLMTTSPTWALGLPIAAKAWRGPRFSKS